MPGLTKELRKSCDFAGFPVDRFRVFGASLLAIIAMSPVAPVDAQEKVTLLVDDAYPPYSYVSEGGEAAGLYIDVVRKADELLTSYDIELQPIPWKRGLVMIENGKALGILPPYLRKDDRPYIQPYSVPIMEESVVVICNEARFGNRKFERYPDDLKDLIVGNNTGFLVPGPAFFEQAKRGEFRLVESGGTTSNMRKLVAGRIDCYIQDKLAAFNVLYDLGQPTSGLVIAHNVRTETGHVGYSASFAADYREDFIKSFDSVIRKLKQDGIIDDLVNDFLASE